MKKKNTLWYVRQEGEVTGPFPSRVLTNNLMLARLTMDDQACLDGKSWLTIADITVLHPEQEVDVRTKITLDERTGFDRRQSTEDSGEYEQLRLKNRRAPETPDTRRRRHFHPILLQKFREHQAPILWPLIAVAL
jgi:hypothetical protein